MDEQIVKGGSWLATWKHARLYFNDYNFPNYRNDILGFRVCRMRD